MKLPESLTTFSKMIFCLSSVVGMLYLYIDRQNELIDLRIKVRSLAKELREIQENNINLQYQIDQFESPVHLMELARKPTFSHLKYPYFDDVIIIEEDH